MGPTRFTELVGCVHPIQQAPVGFAAGEVELPAAVAAAGGHGMLAAVRMPPPALRERLTALNARTRAYGVNFIAPIAEPEALDAAAEAAPLVEFYIGMPDEGLVERARAGGALVSWQVVSGEEARAAEDAGCDLVVARGIEAGGRFVSGVGLLPLLDEVLESVSLPVVAAGGLATGRGLAAVLAAGAAAARVGTRFLVADEAATHPVHVEGVLAARAADTVVTDAFCVAAPPGPHRVLRSALEAAQALDADVAGTMHLYGSRIDVPRLGADNPTGDATGRPDAMALYAGESAGAVRRRQPAGEIVEEMVREADGLLARLGGGRQDAGRPVGSAA